MFELKGFQSTAAKTISDRYAYFAGHPYRPRKGDRPRPFFQALSALTGAGKTPILAEAVAQLRSHFPCEPIIFWMSKARPVVAQTYANFSAGGKYSELVSGFQVIQVSQLNPTVIDDSSVPLIVMATTGLFNNKDQSEGSLNIYKQDNDTFGNTSPWERLIQRSDRGRRRPLIIVYDEGHNLSEQQADLLAELEPDAYLLASATLTLPGNFSKAIIQPMKLWVEESSDDREGFRSLHALDTSGAVDPQLFITTAVDSPSVVDAGLVKKAIQFDGTTAAMHNNIDALLHRMQLIQNEIDVRGLGFKPKSIYVCKTNIADDGERDDHTKPFHQRQAPPIRIWRYLVQDKGIDPQDIAIYASLKFSDTNLPDEVNLFSKGDKDFDTFSSGDYHHIIFNLSLQEGWDDPACYLAYIDKSMGSKIQVEQVIGRVLRQYGAKHYDSALLNSAHFFLRVDNQRVFSSAIGAVKTKLQREGAPIEIIGNYSNVGSGAEDLAPREIDVPLCHVNVDADAACQRIASLVEDFPTFVEASVDTIGRATAATETVELKRPDANSNEPEWQPTGETNPVRLRWLVTTALRERSSRALAVTDLKGSKFDVRVQIHSTANKHAEMLANTIAEAFYQHAELVYESVRPFTFGTVRVQKQAPAFTNSLYARYSDFNRFELPFAQALDRSGEVWHRNPSNGGFSVPLLTQGETSSFFPDFIVWKSGLVYCIDTKGKHLLTDAVARKLFNIQEDGRTRVLVRFVSQGRQTDLRQKATKGGYTVWKMKGGNPVAVFVDSIEDAVVEAIR